MSQTSASLVEALWEDFYEVITQLKGQAVHQNRPDLVWYAPYLVEGHIERLQGLMFPEFLVVVEVALVQSEHFRRNAS
jgi:hypothetical protein